MLVMIISAMGSRVVKIMSRPMNRKVIIHNCSDKLDMRTCMYFAYKCDVSKSEFPAVFMCGFNTKTYESDVQIVVMQNESGSLTYRVSDNNVHYIRRDDGI